MSSFTLWGSIWYCRFRWRCCNDSTQMKTNKNRQHYSHLICFLLKVKKKCKNRNQSCLKVWGRIKLHMDFSETTATHELTRQKRKSADLYFLTYIWQIKKSTNTTHIFSTCNLLINHIRPFLQSYYSLLRIAIHNSCRALRLVLVPLWNKQIDKEVDQAQ